MLDTYGLHELAWDACDERFGDILVASPADARGRGISLAVREDGAAADLTGAAVYLHSTSLVSELIASSALARRHLQKNDTHSWYVPLYRTSMSCL